MDNLQSLGSFVAASLANPEPPWLLEAFLPAKGLLVIAGRPKRAKKSWLAYMMAMAVASGRSHGVLKAPRKAKVLFFSREGAPVQVAKRFLAIQEGTPWRISECDGLYWVQNGNWWLDEPRHIEQILKWIREMGIELVVWDTFARSFRGNENDAREVGAALRGIEAIRDAGAACILVHHLGKAKIETLGGTADPDAGLRGSSALAGAYDVICSIQEHTIDGEFQQVMISGGKYSDFVEYPYDIAVERDVTSGDPRNARLNIGSAREMSIIEEQSRARF